MAHPDSTTPRVFLVRHGQTEWSAQGRWTGKTDLPLTDTGRHQVTSAASILVGEGKLIDPRSVSHIYISPRLRAQQTFELLGHGKLPAVNSATNPASSITVQTIEDLAEWDYGHYEGLLTKEIRALRTSQGKDGKDWDHFRDGCDGGESAEQVTARIDHLIKSIRDFHKDNMHGEHPSDVILIAHGHILRAFTRRWLGYPMDFPLAMMLEAGGIAVLSYQHHNIAEPAFVLGASVARSN